MLKDVAFRMKLFRLRATFHRLELGKNRSQQAALIEQIPAAQPVR